MDYQRKLKDRQNEIEKQIKLLKESSKPVDLNESIGRLSRMDAIAHQQMAVSNKQILENELRLVLQAFARIENDEFGYCLSCGEEISQKRLKARPETSLCTECMLD